MQIPFLSFSGQHDAIREEIVEAMVRVYDSHWYVLGHEVKQFEAAYAAFNQVQYCVGVGNGLDALHLSLRALEIGPGDEVIVPSNTYIATWLAVSQVGATPVPVEPDINTYNLNPDKINEVLTSRTRAILPVHMFGQACEMEGIMSLANQRGLYVIEDNAQAHGATYKGQLTGSFGHINATSFYPSKNLGALGDAGAITTNDDKWVHRLRMLRNYGTVERYHNEIVGFNSRLDELQAAILSVKLRYIQQWTLKRQQIAQWYNTHLQDVQGVQLPYTAAGSTHVYHLYVLRTQEREALRQYLAKANIGTLIHYPIPPHLQLAYQENHYQIGQFPIAEQLAQTCISMPLWPGLTEKQVVEICANVRAFFK